MSRSFDEGLANKAAAISFQVGKGVIENNIKSDSNTITILTNALANKRDLLHTIDSMRNKLDSMNNGVVFVKPAEELVKIDSDANGKRFGLVLCNKGTVPIRNAEIDIRIVLLNDLTRSYPLQFLRHSFAGNDCWIYHSEMLPFEPGTFYFIYKIVCKNKNETTTDYYTVGYLRQEKQWGMSMSRFAHLFN